MHELPFGVSCKLVTQDGDSVYGPTSVKVRLQLLCRRTIIHLQQTKSKSPPLLTSSIPQKALQMQQII